MHADLTVAVWAFSFGVTIGVVAASGAVWWPVLIDRHQTRLEADRVARTRRSPEYLARLEHVQAHTRGPSWGAPRSPVPAYGPHRERDG